jgi:broad specificity phosphatase PhoE
MKNPYCSLYIVRHGETNWNVKNLVQGHTDIPLNKNGEIQAKNLAKKLKRIKFAAVFSSDLLRAKRTAEIIAAEHNLTVISKQVLRERDFGSFEGQPNQWLNIWRQKLRKGIKKLTDEEEKIIMEIKKEMEPDEKIIDRFIPFLKEISLAYSGKNVLIVTHGGVLRVFLIKLGFFTEEESFSHTIKNTAYVKVLSDGVEFFVEEIFGIEKNKL